MVLDIQPEPRWVERGETVYSVWRGPRLLLVEGSAISIGPEMYGAPMSVVMRIPEFRPMYETGRRVYRTGIPEVYHGLYGVSRFTRRATGTTPRWEVRIELTATTRVPPLTMEAD